MQCTYRLGTAAKYRCQ